jgi:Phage stabilisation protein
VLMETRSHDDMMQLYIHLDDQTIVYDLYASQKLQYPSWYYLSSSNDAEGLYRARNFVYIYDKWTCGDVLDVRKIGFLNKEHCAQYDEAIGYKFETPIVYGDGKNVIVHEMELIATTGTNYEGDFTEQFIRRQYSLDGKLWSDAKQKSLGTLGQFQKRVRWLMCGMLRNWRVERFSGLTKHAVSFARLECLFEKLG